MIPHIWPLASQFCLRVRLSSLCILLVWSLISDASSHAIRHERSAQVNEDRLLPSVMRCTSCHHLTPLLLLSLTVGLFVERRDVVSDGLGVVLVMHFCISPRRLFSRMLIFESSVSLFQDNHSSSSDQETLRSPPSFPNLLPALLPSTAFRVWVSGLCVQPKAG